MERAADLDVIVWRRDRIAGTRSARRLFVCVLFACAIISASLASWVPLQFSIVTVFLFAGPHNWFEFRYFLTRLPARFGKSRDFFLLAFGGIALLTIAYVSFPTLYYTGVWSGENWLMVTGAWNTLLLLWIAGLVWLRGKQLPGRRWAKAAAGAWPVAFALCSLNWLAPEVFSLAIVYLHPLVALWFLDRHLRRTKPEWLGAYRRCLALLPFLIAGLCWQLAKTTSLADDNGLAWRITQHAGAEIFPNVSSHMLVAVHVFLEMLHYGVWLVAIPLIVRFTKPDSEKPIAQVVWDLKTIPLVRHPRGFPKLITTALCFGLFLMLVLWVGFSVDYATTRDVYFAVAIAHVLAEVPFLLRTI